MSSRLSVHEKAPLRTDVVRNRLAYYRRSSCIGGVIEIAEYQRPSLGAAAVTSGAVVDIAGRGTRHPLRLDGVSATAVVRQTCPHGFVQTSDKRTKTIPSVAIFHTRERSRKTPVAYKAR